MAKDWFEWNSYPGFREIWAQIEEAIAVVTVWFQLNGPGKNAQ
jgi:hypothetical protein